MNVAQAMLPQDDDAVMREFYRMHPRSQYEYHFVNLPGDLITLAHMRQLESEGWSHGVRTREFTVFVRERTEQDNLDIRWVTPDHKLEFEVVSFPRTIGTYGSLYVN